MLTVIIILILLGWLAAVISLATSQLPWETDEEFRDRRREELRRKITR